MTTETTRKEQATKHIAHDYPLAKSLLASFFVVLVAGLALSWFFNFFVEHHLPLVTDDWKHVEWHGDVEVSRKPISGTQLYAYRAATVVDLPLKSVMMVFRDTPRHVDWVKDLVESEEWHKSAHHKTDNTFVETEILRHRYGHTIPGVRDREYLMRKTITTQEAADGSGRTEVTAEFISFEDDEKYPVCDGCVRGRNLGSTWTFTPVDDDKTKIVADISVDPEVPNLSPFLINIIQKRWPHVTLNKLVRVCRSNAGKDEKMTAQKILQGFFPLKH